MAVTLLLATGGCGLLDRPPEEEVSETREDDESSSREEGHVPDRYEDVSRPPSGPRYFPEPDGPFFEREDVTIVNPDASKRKPMVLKETTYWLPDEHAETLQTRSNDELVFPLEGNRPLLGYRPGDVVVHKWEMIRHRIESVRVDEAAGEIVWDVDVAKLSEVTRKGNFYMHYKPGAAIPLALDPLDAYLFDGPEELIRGIRAHWDSRLVQRQLEQVSKSQQARPSNAKVPMPGWRGRGPARGRGGPGGRVRTRRQGLSGDTCTYKKQIGADPGGVCERRCSYETNMNCLRSIEEKRTTYYPDSTAQDPHERCRAADQSDDKNEHVDANGECICAGKSPEECIREACHKGSSTRSKCQGYVRSNIHEYMADNGDHSKCRQAGNFVYDPQCVAGVRDDYTKKDRDDDYDHHDEEYDYEYRPYPAAWDVDNPHARCQDSGNTDSNGECICDRGMTEEECIETACENRTRCVCSVDDYFAAETPSSERECIGYVCEQLCGYDDSGNSSSKGDASSFDAGGSLSVCLNTAAREPTGGGQVYGLKKLEGRNNLCPEAAGTLEIPGAFGEPVGYKKAYGPLTFRAYPIFYATAGAKADLSIGFDFCCDIELDAYLGVYLGLGYGMTAALEFMGLSTSKAASFSEFLYQNIATFTIWIIPVEIDAYGRLTGKFNTNASVVSSVAYQRYDESWVYGCLSCDLGGCSKSVLVNPEGGGSVTSCDLPARNRSQNLDDLNGWFTEGGDGTSSNAFEVSAGLEGAVGLELNAGSTKLAKSFFTGSGNGLGAGVLFEPIRMIMNADLAIEAPYCPWNFSIRFGWLFGLAVDLGLTSFGQTWQGLWSALPQYFEEGSLTGGIWEDFFGCGDFGQKEPFDPDFDRCTTAQDCRDAKNGDWRGETPPRDWRCFSGQCVKHSKLRVTLGWTAVDKAADLDLYVEEPSGRVRSAGPDFNAQTLPMVRHDCGGGCRSSGGDDERPRRKFIENYVADAPEHGEYRIWVAINPETTEVERPVDFTVEVERGGEDAMKQTFSGTIDPSQGGRTPVDFSLCSPESEEEFCNQNGLCGCTRATDSCGNKRDFDCGYCAVGAWSQKGMTGGRWEQTGEHTLRQRRNAREATMYVSPESYLNREMTGTIEIKERGTTDYVGFVFGFQKPLSCDGANCDYETFVLAWNAEAQADSEAGLKLVRVEGTDPFDDPLHSNGLKDSKTVDVIAERTGPDKGWEAGEAYDFELVYEKHSVHIEIGPYTLDVAPQDVQGIGEFSEGRFGFFNQSQRYVVYRDFRADPLENLCREE